MVEPIELSLEKKQVAFTGRLASMSRKEAAELVRAYGGEFAPSPTRKTHLLVIGEDRWPLEADGRLTRKVLRARALQEAGHPILIFSEEEFFRALGLEERHAEIHRLYTNHQLSHILELPGARIRWWVRMGLIRPAKVVHRLAYFDFHEVRSAKVLCDLVRSGASPSRVRRSLEALRSWLKHLDEPLRQMALLERNGRLLARLKTGELIEPGGQLWIDFSQDEERPVRAIEPEPRTVDHWLRLGLEHEDRGDLNEAEEAYRQALLEAGPRPELCFNLGNVFYALGSKAQAVERFRQAVELDPQYVEAWNNLGNALSELGEHEEAVKAYERALQLAPRYADAHYNFADTLFQVGRVDDAKLHWRAYLRESPRSSWAEEVRGRLRQAGEEA